NRGNRLRVKASGEESARQQVPQRRPAFQGREVNRHKSRSRFERVKSAHQFVRAPVRSGAILASGDTPRCRVATLPPESFFGVLRRASRVPKELCQNWFVVLRRRSLPGTGLGTRR